jgi:predicted acyltransferase (DUF342 family)
MAQNRALPENSICAGWGSIMLILLFMLLVLLFLFPFIPGIYELIRQLDAEPLKINMDYRKDPRFFSVSFKKILAKSLSSGVEGLHLIKMSKQEITEVVENGVVGDGFILDNIYYVKNDLRSGAKVLFAKEVYVKRNAHIGEGNQMRALACDGDVHISRQTKFLRWLDAEGSIKVEEGCQLGMSATCGRELSLARHCSFKRLYGFPVITGLTAQTHWQEDGDAAVFEAEAAIREAAVVSATENYQPNNGEIIGFMGGADQKLLTIPAHSRRDGNLITANSLRIGSHTVIRGHVKTHGAFVADTSVIIIGNIFAEGDICLGTGSRIYGTVFSQGRITCAKGVTIGSHGRIKSVIGRKGVIFDYGVRVYGLVMTEGEGLVV